MRAQPGTLHGDGHIGIHHTESFTGQQFHTPFQQHHAVYPGILRRRIRKMEPDIAQSGGTEQGIAQRMHGHVAVRMGHASPVVLQVDSAKPQAQPRREGMHVVTVPHPEAIGKSPIHNSQFEDCKLRIFSLFLHFLADGGKRLKSRNNILNDNQGAAQERAALRPEHPAARGRHRMPQGRKNAKAMSEISRLEPRAVWEIFDEITQVPRPSKKEEKIIAYLERFARKHSLDYRKDTAGNIVMYKKATPSMAGKPTVVLQSHMDMVCEKNADVAFDFMTDPIQPYIDGEWVKARGTTLGADDGIGMATALALITAEGVEHPDLEALFTVDEETGLTGAFNLGSDMLSGRYLINLDSEDDGEIFIGCAGGVDTVATFRYREEPAPEGMTWMQADISGLKGGHSGDNINDGLGNSNKLLTRLLLAGTERMGLRLASFDGGNLRNAIPREAHAVFGVPAGQADEMRRLTGQFAATFAEEYKYTDAGVRLEVREAGKPATVIDAGTQRSLLLALQGVANGVLAMSRSMPGLVETSTNLASVKFADEGRIVVTSSQRCRSRARRRLSGLEPRPVEQAAPSGGDGLRTPVRHAAQSTRHPRGTGVRSLPRKISEARNDIGRPDAARRTLARRTPRNSDRGQVLEIPYRNPQDALTDTPALLLPGPLHRGPCFLHVDSTHACRDNVPANGCIPPPHPALSRQRRPNNIIYTYL